MKRAIHISLSLLIFLAMLHISVAMHYCEGKVVGSEVSLSGKLATCGMKCTSGKMPLAGTCFTKNCCDNILFFCGTSGNYSPSYQYVPVTYSYPFCFLAIQLDLSVKYQKETNLVYSGVSPPGAFMSTDVDLPGICVFRI